MKTLSIILRYAKTVKLDAVFSENCTFERVEISGDFFVYPEESLEILENSLKGCGDEHCVENALSTLSNATILGFDPVDLKRRLTDLIDQCRSDTATPQ